LNFLERLRTGRRAIIETFVQNLSRQAPIAIEPMIGDSLKCDDKPFRATVRRRSRIENRLRTLSRMWRSPTSEELHVPPHSSGGDNAPEAVRRRVDTLDQKVPVVVRRIESPAGATELNDATIVSMCTTGVADNSGSNERYVHSKVRRTRILVNKVLPCFPG
jgi:hypothetical protein